MGSDHVLACEGARAEGEWEKNLFARGKGDQLPATFILLNRIEPTVLAP